MARKRKQSEPPATDFVYTFHLSPRGEMRHESIAGAFTEITGYQPGALPRRGWAGLVYPKDLSLLAPRPTALLAGLPDVREYRLLTADGHLRWIRDYAQPMNPEPDGSVFVFAAAQEITARKRQQEEMGRLASIVESSQDAIMDVTLDGVIVSWNRAAEKIYGYSSDEVKGRTTTLLVPTDRIDEMARILADMRRQGSVLRMETVRLHKDGRAIPVALTVAPVRDPAGQLAGASIISRDISQLKLAESALEENAAKTTAILSTMVDGVITIDEHGVIDSFNPAAERLFGYSFAEVAGKNIKLLMPEPYHSEHDDYLRNYLRTGKTKIIGIGREVVGRRKDGSIFPMDLAVSVMFLGQRRLFAGIVRDLTDRKRMERQILEISDREQRRIGQDLHDGLGQQLAGIGFLSKSLQQRLTRRKAPQAADASQIADLVAQAIAQARGMAHGLHPVDMSATGLVSALKELALTVQHTFRIECSFTCDEPVLLSDGVVATHLYRIAQEAVNNAIKHGKAEHVWIVLHRVGDTIRVSVRDNGVGFPDTLPEKKGMGLQTMRYRAALIGATLSILKVPSGGTRVDCSVKQSDSAPESIPNMAKTQTTPRQKKKVFLIDDHPIVRQGLGRLIDDQPDLAICGEAESPVQALRLLPGAKPDVVILDLTLKGGDGLELCKQIRDRFSALPILVVSMHDESLYAERALKAGARGYVMKQEPQETVMTALRTVASGEVYLSAKMSAKLLRSFSGTKSDSDLPPLERLTDRELEIFRLIGDGNSVRTIAEKLFLSTKTVEAHKEHIKQKLNLKSSNELLQYAIEARIADRQ